MWNQRLVSTLLTLGLVLGGSTALAKSSFKTKVPNGNVAGCSTCHTKTSPPAAWNSFGLDVKANLSGGSPNWSAICHLDSDGDGFTNGEELLDPDCLWSTGTSMPGAPTDVTQPGDANDVPPEPEPEPEPEPDVIESDDASTGDEDAAPGPIEDAGPEPEPEPDVVDASDAVGPEPEEDTWSWGREQEIDAMGTHLDSGGDPEPEDAATTPPEPDVSVADASDVPDHGEPVAGGCLSDSDCGEAQTCVEADSGEWACQDIACSSDADCPGAFQCTWPVNAPDGEAGSCMPVGGPMPDDDDAAPDEGGGGGCGAGTGADTSGLPWLAVLALAATVRRRTRLV